MLLCILRASDESVHVRDNARRGVRNQELMEDAEAINSWLWTPQRTLSRLYHGHLPKKRNLDH